MRAQLVSSCKSCPSRESAILRGQSEKSICVFSDRLTRYSIKGKGKTIFNQGELATGVYFLCKGLVKLTKVTEQGEEIIVEMLVPCSIIGGVNLVEEKKTRVCSAVTLLELTEVAFLKKEDLRLLLESHPMLGIGFTQHISERLREIYKWIVSMKLPVEKRLLALLARILVLVGWKYQKELIEIPFSYRELAQFAQTTPETLSRVLRGLQEKRIIKVEKRGLRVLKDNMLKKYLEEDSHRD